VSGPVDDEVDGWVLPETPGLGQRPLILGLPYPAAGGLILAAMSMSLLANWWAAATVTVASFWALGAALTRHDPWLWEVMMRAARYPGRLDAG
jgi:type IV secretory pathway VirB3-like protein